MLFNPENSYIDSQSDQYVKTLAECVAIKSVSAQTDTRNDTINMVKWMQNVRYFDFIRLG